MVKVLKASNKRFNYCFTNVITKRYKNGKCGVILIERKRSYHILENFFLTLIQHFKNSKKICLQHFDNAVI